MTATKATNLPKKVIKRDASFVEFAKGNIRKAIEGAAFDATLEDVRKIYLMAHSLRCKGITIYRYGSKEDQVLSFDHREGTQSVPKGELITVDSDYSGGCVTGTCPF